MGARMSTVLALITLSGAACHSMRPVPLESLPGANAGQVWVTRTDQSVVLVSGPRIVNNRLVGFIEGKYQVIPAAEVQQVTVRRVAPAKTGALVAAGLVGAGTVLYLISGTGGHEDPCASASSDACQTGDISGS